eukprot:14785619-Ditylum_brightwellii.AAC.1
MFVQIKRWGQPPKRTKVTVIVIQCAAEDTSYLKHCWQPPMKKAYEKWSAKNFTNTNCSCIMNI